LLQVELYHLFFLFYLHDDLHPIFDNIGVYLPYFRHN
jgi:hypothetical protein